MRGTLLPILAALALVACGPEKPVPEGYAGPLAHVDDSVVERTGTSFDFFYLSEIDGQEIEQSLSESVRANRGSGFYMKPVVVTRAIPARPARFLIVGTTHSAAPVLALFNDNFYVSGVTSFTPLPDHHYLVIGVLSEDSSAVWIEDRANGEVMGTRIEATKSD